MAISSTTLLLSIGVILLLARPAHAFGAGNIASVSSIEGSNCEFHFHYPSISLSTYTRCRCTNR